MGFPAGRDKQKSARREGKKKGYIPGLRDRRWPGWTRIEYMCAGFSLFDEQLTNHHAPSSFEARIGRLRGQRRGAWLAAAGQYVRSQRPLGQLPGTADVLVSCNFLRTFCVIHHSLVIGCYRWYSVLGPCGKKKKKTARSHATAACGRPESGRTVCGNMCAEGGTWTGSQAAVVVGESGGRVWLRVRITLRKVRLSTLIRPCASGPV